MASVGSTAYAQKGGGGGGGGNGGNGGACPSASPAGGGDPSCGKPRPKPPAPTGCTLGPIVGTVDAVDFGPLDPAVHDVLCALAENGITV